MRIDKVLHDGASIDVCFHKRGFLRKGRAPTAVALLTENNRRATPAYSRKHVIKCDYFSKQTEPISYCYYCAIRTHNALLTATYKRAYGLFGTENCAFLQPFEDAPRPLLYAYVGLYVHMSYK